MPRGGQRVHASGVAVVVVKFQLAKKTLAYCYRTRKTKTDTFDNRKPARAVVVSYTRPYRDTETLANKKIHVSLKATSSVVEACDTY